MMTKGMSQLQFLVDSMKDVTMWIYQDCIGVHRLVSIDWMHVADNLLGDKDVTPWGVFLCGGPLLCAEQRAGR